MRIRLVNLKGAFGALRHAFSVSLFAATVLCVSLFAAYLFDSGVCYTAACAANEKRVIIIDAGHGGEDSGAIGIGEKYEKDLNLQIAFTLGAELEKRGFAVVYTRTEDKMLYLPEENIKGIRKLSDLKNRIKIAQAYPEALFISIHMNSYSSDKYSGLQAYYKPNDEESRILANYIQSGVVKDVQPDNNRVIKSGDGLYLLENCENTSVIVECGFMSNAEELQKLCEKEYQKQLSFSIACAIIEYMNR